MCGSSRTVAPYSNGMEHYEYSSCVTHWSPPVPDSNSVNSTTVSKKDTHITLSSDVVDTSASPRPFLPLQTRNYQHSAHALGESEPLVTSIPAPTSVFSQSIHSWSGGYLSFKFEKENVVGLGCPGSIVRSSISGCRPLDPGSNPGQGAKVSLTRDSLPVDSCVHDQLL
jgi:hypothetical protein